MVLSVSSYSVDLDSVLKSSLREEGDGSDTYSLDLGTTLNFFFGKGDGGGGILLFFITQEDTCNTTFFQV